MSNIFLKQYSIKDRFSGQEITKTKAESAHQARLIFWSQKDNAKKHPNIVAKYEKINRVNE
jgi:hypothetical protein